MASTPRFQIAVDTNAGRFIRKVWGPLDLPPARTLGASVEAGVIAASSTWGLRDFVFAGSEIQLGSGRRELGDSLLIAPPYGVVIQVKARNSVNDTPERATNWLNKKIAEGNRQVSGSLRHLKLKPRELTNERGTRLIVPAAEIQWVGLTIVEHSQIPKRYFPTSPPTRGVVLLRADWEFLWEQLQSTVEVVRYLNRIAQYPPAELGKESHRYYELALADEAVVPTPLDHPWLNQGGHRVSTPYAPFAPAGLEPSHYVVRQILEDIASVPIPAETNPMEFIKALALFDSIPVSVRDELGRKVLERLAVTPDVGSTLWWSRRMNLQIPGTPLVFIVTCSHPYEAMIARGFEVRAELVHDDWLQLVGADSSPKTIAVLLTPSLDPNRSWDSTMIMVSYQTLLTPEERTRYEQAIHAEEIRPA